MMGLTGSCVRFPVCDSADDQIIRLGRGARLAKIYVKHAYRKCSSLIGSY